MSSLPENTDPNPHSSGSPKRVILKDIAQVLGVSHATVSMALRDHPKIAEKTREKVKAKAKEMGYEPDPILAGLAHYRNTLGNKPLTSALAWLNTWPEPEELFQFKVYRAYWEGAKETALKFGYYPLIPVKKITQEIGLALSGLYRISNIRNEIHHHSRTSDALGIPSIRAS